MTRYKMTQTNKLLAFSALALLLTSGFPALAEDNSESPAGPAGEERPLPPRDGPHDGPDGGPHGGDPKDMERRGGEMFMRADVNKDGYLSKEEMLDAHKGRIDEMFSTADTDHDSKLSREEMKQGREAMHKKFREKMEDRKDRRDEMRGSDDRPGDDSKSGSENER